VALTKVLTTHQIDKQFISGIFHLIYLGHSERQELTSWKVKSSMGAGRGTVFKSLTLFT
jgi:hypothetical protein